MFTYFIFILGLVTLYKNNLCGKLGPIPLELLTRKCQKVEKKNKPKNIFHKKYSFYFLYSKYLVRESSKAHKYLEIHRIVPIIPASFILQLYLIHQQI